MAQIPCGNMVFEMKTQGANKVRKQAEQPKVFAELVKLSKSKTYSQKAQFAADLTKQKIIQDNGTGFLFCPQCGSVVVSENPNAICCQCGYRFCPSCGD